MRLCDLGVTSIGIKLGSIRSAKNESAERQVKAGIRRALGNLTPHAGEAIILIMSADCRLWGERLACITSMRRIFMKIAATFMLIALVWLAGCATREQSGALAGGAAGGLLGSALGHGPAAMLLGAAAGAAVGGLIGNRMDRQDQTKT